MGPMLVYPIFWITLVTWGCSPAYLHPAFGLILVLVGIAGVAVAIRKLIRGELAFQAATNALPIDNYRWLKRWDAVHFNRHFNSFLQVHGWRVLSAAVLGQDRVEFVAEKDRCVIALLCLRPGQGTASGDLGHIEALRQSRKAARAALVTEAKPQPEEMHEAARHNVMRLQFEDLERLSEVFHLDGYSGR